MPKKSMRDKAQKARAKRILDTTSTSSTSITYSSSAITSPSTNILPNLGAASSPMSAAISSVFSSGALAANGAADVMMGLMNEVLSNMSNEQKEQMLAMSTTNAVTTAIMATTNALMNASGSVSVHSTAHSILNTTPVNNSPNRSTVNSAHSTSGQSTTTSVSSTSVHISHVQHQNNPPTPSHTRCPHSHPHFNPGHSPPHSSMHPSLHLQSSNINSSSHRSSSPLPSQVPVSHSRMFHVSSSSSSPSSSTSMGSHSPRRHASPPHIASPSSSAASSTGGPEEGAVKMLMDASRLGLIDTVSAVLDNGLITQQHIDVAFLTAAEFGHLKLLHLLVTRVSSFLCANTQGETALLLAARHGQYEVCRALLSIGCPVDCRRHDGVTPLYAAVEFNQSHVAALLLEHKANVNSVDNHRNSILHVAASNGYTPMVLLCLQAGAATNVLNDKDATPLEVAKNSDVCRAVLEFHTQSRTTPPPSTPPFEPQSTNSTSSSSSSSSYTMPTATPSVSPPASTVALESSPHVHPPNLLTPCSPFRELPAGPSSYLFWTAMGVGKDSYMFQNFGVFPFDRLNDTERIIVLTEVAEAMSGYKSDLPCNLLNESALYAVFALMKARIKKELEDSGDDEHESSFIWRKRVLEAYEQVYCTSASLAGLSLECWKRSVWNTVINLLARSLFGESFWDKKRVFLSPNGLDRAALLRHLHLDVSYFQCKLPSTASVEIQLTFKKLITMSKTFLCDEPVRPSGCFCQDCIAELEVPLTFKLQFLEEAAEEKRKIKKGRKNKEKKATEVISADSELSKAKLDELLRTYRKELKNFWSSISIEEKWCLTEMSTSELSDIIGTHEQWETLRAALDSYAKYAWDEDVLEITDDCVTIADDMCEEKGMSDILDAMLDAVDMLYKEKPQQPSHPSTSSHIQQYSHSSHSHPHSHGHYHGHGHQHHHPSSNDDEWDKQGRQLLESSVLVEFARKIAIQYVLKKQECKAQQVALELELELLQEEEEQAHKSKGGVNNKKKKKKNKRQEREEKDKKKNSVNAPTVVAEKKTEDAEENEEENDSIEEEIEDLSLTTVSLTDTAFDNLSLNKKKPAKSISKPITEEKSDKQKTVDKGSKVTIPSKPSTPTEAASAAAGNSITPTNASKKAIVVTATSQSVLKEKPASLSAPLSTPIAVPATTPVSDFVDGLLLTLTREMYDIFLSTRLLPLHRPLLGISKHVKPRVTALFIFTTPDRALHGIWEITGIQGDNFNPTAYPTIKPINNYSLFPNAPTPVSICEVNRLEEWESVKEAGFRHVFTDGSRSRKLENKQTKELLHLLRRGKPASVGRANAEKNTTKILPKPAVLPPVVPTESVVSSVTKVKPLSTILPASITVVPMKPAPWAAAATTATVTTSILSQINSESSPSSSSASASASSTGSSDPAPISTNGNSAAVSGAVKNVWKARAESKSELSSTYGAPTTSASPGIIVNPTITIVPSSLQGTAWKTASNTMASGVTNRDGAQKTTSTPSTTSTRVPTSVSISPPSSATSAVLSVPPSPLLTTQSAIATPQASNQSSSSAASVNVSWSAIASSGRATSITSSPAISPTTNIAAPSPSLGAIGSPARSGQVQASTSPSSPFIASSSIGSPFTLPWSQIVGAAPASHPNEAWRTDETNSEDFLNGTEDNDVLRITDEVELGVDPLISEEARSQNSASFSAQIQSRYIPSPSHSPLPPPRSPQSMIPSVHSVLSTPYNSTLSRSQPPSPSMLPTTSSVFANGPIPIHGHPPMHPSTPHAQVSQLEQSLHHMSVSQHEPPIPNAPHGQHSMAYPHSQPSHFATSSGRSHSPSLPYGSYSQGPSNHPSFNRSSNPSYPMASQSSYQAVHSNSNIGGFSNKDLGQQTFDPDRRDLHDISRLGAFSNHSHPFSSNPLGPSYSGVGVDPNRNDIPHFASSSVYDNETPSSYSASNLSFGSVGEHIHSHPIDESHSHGTLHTNDDNDFDVASTLLDFDLRQTLSPDQSPLADRKSQAFSTQHLVFGNYSSSLGIHSSAVGSRSDDHLNSNNLLHHKSQSLWIGSGDGIWNDPQDTHGRERSSSFSMSNSLHPSLNANNSNRYTEPEDNWAVEPPANKSNLIALPSIPNSFSSDIWAAPTIPALNSFKNAGTPSPTASPHLLSRSHPSLQDPRQIPPMINSAAQHQQQSYMPSNMGMHYPSQPPHEQLLMNLPSHLTQHGQFPPGQHHLNQMHSGMPLTNNGTRGLGSNPPPPPPPQHHHPWNSASPNPPMSMYGLSMPPPLSQQQGAQW